MDNLIYYDSNAFVNKNYGETTHQGFDVKTVTRTDNFIYNLNVSNVISEFDTGSNKGKQLPMVANWKSEASVKYNYDKYLNFSFASQFVGSRYRIGDESNTSQKSKVNNIFDKKHYHYETSGGVYPLSQRNMSLKFKYLF